MHGNTLFWHDYETFGTDPRKDRPVQFAGVRTDTDLKIIDAPVTYYCKPVGDYLPDPEACLVTGITPQQALDKGVCEAEFIRLVHEQLSCPGTCTLGYNSLRFDDEVTRHTLYRNFYDPYAREWQHGNSRWDLIDLVRAARALRPEGINWPQRDDGKPSFRLEDLTAANGLEHSSAHDALSDVYATLSLAKLLKQAQPKLYQFLFEHRSKASINTLLKLGSHTPLVHVSGMYPSDKGCIAVVLPLCKHPVNKNGVLVYDLGTGPELMLSLSVDEIQARIFTASENLPEGTARIPLKTVHVNKCPVLAPTSVLRSQDRERLEIDLASCMANRNKILQRRDSLKKLAAVFSKKTFDEPSDPDLMLYSGGFFSDADKYQMETIRNTPAEQLAQLDLNFKDSRLPEMLFRYRARNYPQTLDKNEKLRWREFCQARLDDNQRSMDFDTYLASIDKLLQQPECNSTVLDALKDYAQSIRG